MPDCLRQVSGRLMQLSVACVLMPEAWRSAKLEKLNLRGSQGPARSRRRLSFSPKRKSSSQRGSPAAITGRDRCMLLPMEAAASAWPSHSGLYRCRFLSPAAPSTKPSPAKRQRSLIDRLCSPTGTERYMLLHSPGFSRRLACQTSSDSVAAGSCQPLLPASRQHLPRGSAPCAIACAQTQRGACCCTVVAAVNAWHAEPLEPYCCRSLLSVVLSTMPTPAKQERSLLERLCAVKPADDSSKVLPYRSGHKGW